MTSSGYPLLLHVEGRRVLVVGAGPVATRRAGALVDQRADVVVVAPAGTPEMAALPVTWHHRPYADGDLDGAWLVHAATDDTTVNDAVSADAEHRGVWCVRADDAERSAAWVPAVLRAEGLTVAVNAGRDPRRARAVRDVLADRLPDLLSGVSVQPRDVRGPRGPAR
jgi:uroporphyrin-III C-methyltransferase/precorrin-2 dehydrogenase/sirohydrochlorin ferrochelatase